MLVLSPARLTIARELQCMSQKDLAEVMALSPATISMYERGQTPVSDAVLRRLSLALQVPLEFLTDVEEIEPVDPQQCFYRCRARTRVLERRYIERAQQLFRHIMTFIEGLDHIRLPEVNLPRPELSRISSPAAAAIELRRHWGLGDGPIPNLIDLLEKNGIWIHMLRGRAAENIDAFSIRHQGAASILLNPMKEDAYRSRFDAAHELGHLVMHRLADDGAHQEEEADAFAAEFLVPTSTWRLEAPRSTRPGMFLPFKARWRVSAAALIRRTHDVRVLNDQQYKSAMVAYSSLGWRKGEPGMKSVPHECPRLLNLCLGILSKRGVTIDAIASELRLGSHVMYDVLGISAPDLPPHPDRNNVFDLAKRSSREKVAS